MDVFNEMFLNATNQKSGKQSTPSTSEQSQPKPTSAPRTPLPTSASEQTTTVPENPFKDIQPIKGLTPFPPPKERAAEKTPGEDKATLERLWKEAGLWVEVKTKEVEMKEAEEEEL